MSSFKPGHWIKSTRYPNLRPIQITSIYESNTRPGILGLKSKGTVLYSDEVELWQPKPNEWCWFWSKSFPKPQLLPFRSYFKNSFYSTEYGVTIFNEVLCECNYFDYCEPFIGQLPTFIKDQS